MTTVNSVLVPRSLSLSLSHRVCDALQLPDGDPDGEQAVPQRAVQVPGAHAETGVPGGAGHAPSCRGADGG